MIVENIYIGSLLKAFENFEDFRKDMKTKRDKAGAIQAFEYCFELTWKIMKKFLDERGKIANSPKEVFRMSALENFIGDPEIWFEFLKMRNLTVYTYEEIIADEVIAILPRFSNELSKFLKYIGVSDANH